MNISLCRGQCTSVVWICYNRSDRLRNRASHLKCRLVCSAVWDDDFERPLTYAMWVDPDDWSDCSTKWKGCLHIDYTSTVVDGFNPQTQYRSSPIVSKHLKFEPIVTELIYIQRRRGSVHSMCLFGYSLRIYDVTYVVRANLKWRRHSYHNLTSYLNSTWARAHTPE